MDEPVHHRRESTSTSPAATGDGTVGRALARLEEAIERKPGFGHTTQRSTTVTSQGLQCRSTEGEHGINSDLPCALGGAATAPSPTAFLRAALGSCLAIGYRLRAARHGVALGAIRVTVDTDSVLAGMLLPGSAMPAGFVEVRYHVDIETEAPAADIDGLVAEADLLSPVLHALRANSLRPSLSIMGSAR